MHPYERLTVEPDLASGVFGDSQALRAWTLTRESIAARARAWPGDAGAGTPGAAGLSQRGRRQASELVLQDLLEQIAALLRPVHTVGVFDRVGPLQIEEIGHTRLGQRISVMWRCVRWPVEAFALALSA